MINAEQALRIVRKSLEPLGKEKVKVVSACHRVLAEDIISPEPVPSFMNSSIDGFAVKAAELAHASRRTPVVLNVAGESGAGNPYDGDIRRGQTVQVMTGGMIPRGLDSVVPVEDVKEGKNAAVKFFAPVVRGAYIRKTGEDIRKGHKVLRAGEIITEPAVGVLASLGFGKVKVHRSPRVNIMATGDELVAMDDIVQAGQVRNSTSAMLDACIREDGGVPERLGIVPDRRKKIRRKIAEGLDCDLLLITGGASVGKFDYVRKTLEDIGAEILFWKVNIRPGRPLLFARFGKVPVFGLPGNPVSTMITYRQFVRPALQILQGRRYRPPLRLQGQLDHDFSKTDGRLHFVRCIVERRGGVLRVRSAGEQHSNAMTPMVSANCLMIVPEKVRRIRKNAKVEIELL
jgi:molybdopterin molybdotransferase